MRSKEEIEAVILNLKKLSAGAHHAGQILDCIQIATIYDALEWVLGDDTAAFADYVKATAAIDRAKRQ